MIEGIDIKQVVDFTAAEDKENPTIWKIGVLATDEYIDVTSTSNQQAPLKFIYDIVRLGLKGWVNFKVNGADFAYKTEEVDFMGKKRMVVAEHCMKAIPMNIVSELGTKILALNTVGKDEEKNS